MVLTGNTETRAGGWVVVCVAQFVVVLDATIVTTALPAIGADLGFSAAWLPWVFTAYTIVLAGLLVLGGRIADQAGARLMFRLGLLVFSIASLACALGWSPAALIGSRLAQGVGAAMLSPAALAALSESLHGDAARRALGWWTAAGAAGGASGWFVGGLITQLAGWRGVFAVNVPIGLAALIWSRRALPGRGRTGTRGLDLPGACSITAAIALAALGLAEVARDASAWQGWGALGAAVFAMLLFTRIERASSHPLVPSALVRTPGVLGGNLTAAALTASTSPAMITAALYVQDTLQLPPLQAGLLFPVFNIAVIGGSLLGPRAARRIGVRRLLLIGFIGVAAGVTLLVPLPADGVPLPLLLGGFTVMGSSLGITSVASTTAGTASVRAGQRGVAAGVLSSSAQLGTSLGLALVAPIIASAAPMTGYRLGFLAAIAIALAGAVAALTVPRAVRRTRAELG